MPDTTTDKPRKIVVCSWDDYPAIQAVIAHEYGDVLVQPRRWMDAGTAYVMDPPSGVIRGFSWEGI